MVSLKQEPKKLQSTKEVTEMLIHTAMCEDCGKAYDDWYYSPKNSNFEKYMKEDRQFKAKVEGRQKS
jgi:hypothetical protein